MIGSFIFDLFINDIRPRFGGVLFLCYLIEQSVDNHVRNIATNESGHPRQLQPVMTKQPNDCPFMRYLLLIFLIVFINPVLACRCNFLEALSKADIDKTDYIALVRIKEILPVKVDSPRYSGYTTYIKIVVEEITHYKGGHFTEIIVTGGHEKFNTWTSCDFDMNEGEEWVIFGQYHQGRSFVYPCGRSERYRRADGFRDWQYQRGIKERQFLDQFFQKQSPPAVRKTGAVKEYFPNGKYERVTRYKSGKLHGPMSYYYPDGTIHGKGLYRKGQLHQQFIWYYPDGTVMNKRTYRKGVLADTSFYFEKSTDSYYPRFITVYSKKGETTLFQEFGGINGKSYPISETVYQRKQQKEKTTHYYPNGKIKALGFRVAQKNYGEYIEYDEQGNIVRKWTYDDEGNRIQ